MGRSPSGPQYTDPGAVNCALNRFSWGFPHEESVSCNDLVPGYYVPRLTRSAPVFSYRKEPTLEWAGPPQVRSTRILGR